MTTPRRGAVGNRPSIRDFPWALGYLLAITAVAVVVTVIGGAVVSLLVGHL